MLPAKCDICEYNCKNSNTMTRHMNTKHAEQKCNVCQKVFGTSIEVLQHVAKEHISYNESKDYEGQGETSCV